MYTPTQQELIDAVDQAPMGTQKRIYKRLAPYMEDIIIRLPASGSQALDQRYGGTDLVVDKINVYASEGVVELTVGKHTIRAKQDGTFTVNGADGAHLQVMSDLADRL